MVYVYDSTASFDNPDASDNSDEPYGVTVTFKRWDEMKMNSILYIFNEHTPS